MMAGGESFSSSFSSHFLCSFFFSAVIDGRYRVGDNGGRIGLFPSGCVAEILATSATQPPTLARKVSDASLTKFTPNEPHPSEKSRALQSFTGQADSELSFTAGDEINVLDKTKEWWVGEKGGVIGQFPSSYVSLVASKEVLYYILAIFL